MGIRAPELLCVTRGCSHDESCGNVEVSVLVKRVGLGIPLVTVMVSVSILDQGSGQG